MSAKIKYGLSAAVLALIAAGASAPQILDQFLDEKEGSYMMRNSIMQAFMDMAKAERKEERRRKRAEAKAK